MTERLIEYVDGTCETHWQAAIRVWCDDPFSRFQPWQKFLYVCFLAGKACP